MALAVNADGSLQSPPDGSGALAADCGCCDTGGQGCDLCAGAFPAQISVAITGYARPTGSIGIWTITGGQISDTFCVGALGISATDPWAFIFGSDPTPVGCFLWACVPNAYGVTLTNPDDDSHTAACNLLVVVGYEQTFFNGLPSGIVRRAAVFAYGIDDPDSEGVGRAGLLLANMAQAIDPDEVCFASFDISADDPTTDPPTVGGLSASADATAECDQQLCGPGCPTDCTDCCDDLCFTFSNGARGGFTKNPDDGCRYIPAPLVDNIGFVIRCQMYGFGDWIWLADFNGFQLASTVNAPCPPTTAAGWGNPVLPGGVTIASITCAPCAATPPPTPCATDCTACCTTMRFNFAGGDMDGEYEELFDDDPTACDWVDNDNTIGDVLAASLTCADGVWTLNIQRFADGGGPHRTWTAPADVDGCPPSDPAAWDETSAYGVSITSIVCT